MAPTTITCTTGQKADPSGICINLPAGSVCPNGVANGSGVCVAPPAGTCPAGQTMENGVCVIGSSAMDSYRTAGSKEMKRKNAGGPWSLRPLRAAGTAAD